MMLLVSFAMNHLKQTLDCNASEQAKSAYTGFVIAMAYNLSLYFN